MYEKSPCHRELMKPKAAGRQSSARLPTSMDSVAIPLATTSELDLGLSSPTRELCCLLCIWCQG